MIAPVLTAFVGADAALDTDLAYDWYVEQAGEDVADRYLASLQETRKTLCRQPDLGTVCRFRNPKLSKLRSFCVSRPFNKHLIFYRIEGDLLVIFRVLHGMRDLPRRLLQPPGTED